MKTNNSHLSSRAIVVAPTLALLAILVPCSFAAVVVLPPAHEAAQPVTALDESAPISQDQLFSFAIRAFEGMETLLPGGAGVEVTTLITHWPSPAAANSDPVTLGQLKAVGQPFHNRLIDAGLTDRYPWDTGTAWANDQAPATLGQAEAVFAFALFLENDGLNAADGPGQPAAAGQNSSNPVKSPNAAVQSSAGALIRAASTATAPAVPADKKPASAAQSPGGLKITIDYPAPGEKV